MRALAVFLLALALLPARTLYVLEWQSTMPIEPTSITASVTGGELRTVLVAEDGMTGWIEADAPRACLTIRATARTTNGIPVVFARSWDTDCDRLFLPLVTR